MSDFKVVLPTTTEEWQRDMNIAYQSGVADCLEEFVENVLYELNGIAEDESYYFNKDNVKLVSIVMYSHLEQSKKGN